MPVRCSSAVCLLALNDGDKVLKRRNPESCRFVRNQILLQYEHQAYPTRAFCVTGSIRVQEYPGLPGTPHDTCGPTGTAPHTGQHARPRRQPVTRPSGLPPLRTPGPRLESAPMSAPASFGSLRSTAQYRMRHKDTFERLFTLRYRLLLTYTADPRHVIGC